MKCEAWDTEEVLWWRVSSGVVAQRRAGCEPDKARTVSHNGESTFRGLHFPKNRRKTPLQWCQWQIIFG